jgi:hypothetical protein
LCVDPKNNPNKLAGWWFQPTRLKNDGVKVSWDDEIPNIWKKQSHASNHQPDISLTIINHYQPLLTTINHY